MTLDPGGAKTFEQQVADAMIQNLQGHQASMLTVVDQLAPRVAAAIDELARQLAKCETDYAEEHGGSPSPDALTDARLMALDHLRGGRAT